VSFDVEKDRKMQTKEKTVKLSFMTFVCPTWEIEKAVAFARDTDFDGIEIRVDAGHKHGISSQTSPTERKRVRDLFDAAGVDVACIATSCNFAFPDPALHAENLAAAKANLDLAADLGAPLVRIFAGGKIPELTSEAADQVAAAFDEVGTYAAPSGVCPMLECGHDIIKGASEAEAVLKRLSVRNAGALWNHAAMDDATYAVLKDRLRHFHVHGDVLDPTQAAIADLIGRMNKVGYTGFISLEVIKGEDLPEDLLRTTASRLKGHMTPEQP
jgi:sugar phosphate isomerase/epimerase